MPQAREISIPGVPSNFKLLLHENPNGYKLAHLYFLELEHGCMGTYPALIEGTDEVVLVTDQELLKRIWQLLPPQRSKMSWSLYYVNQELRVAFRVPQGEGDLPPERIFPHRFLTEKELDQMTAIDPYPFEWASGVTTNYITAEEFLKIIESSAVTPGISSLT